MKGGCARVNTWIWFSGDPDSLRIEDRPKPFLNNHLLLLSYQHLPDISDTPPPSPFLPKQNHIVWESSTEANPCPPHQSSSTSAAMAAVYSAAPLHTRQPVAYMQMCWVSCRHTDDYMLIPSQCHVCWSLLKSFFVCCRHLFTDHRPFFCTSAKIRGPSVSLTSTTLL